MAILLRLRKLNCGFRSLSAPPGNEELTGLSQNRDGRHDFTRDYRQFLARTRPPPSPPKPCVFAKTNPPNPFRKISKTAPSTPSEIAGHKNPRSFFRIPATTYSPFSRPAAHPTQILMRERAIYGYQSKSKQTARTHSSAADLSQKKAAPPPPTTPSKTASPAKPSC